MVYAQPNNVQNAKVFFVAGFDLLKQKQSADAIMMFNKGLKLDPNNGLARYYLAEAYRQQGDIAQAIAQYKQAQQKGDAKTQAKAKQALAQLTPNQLANTPPTTEPANPQAEEIAYWSSIKNSNNPKDYKNYLKKYPNGLFVELAQAKLQTKAIKDKPNSVRNEFTPQASQKSSNEELMKKGLWRDPENNLIWMRCSLGQTWNGKACKGKAKQYTWQEAIDAAKALNNNDGFGGYSDWVVPHIEDLSTIRYCSTEFEETTEIPSKAGGTKTVGKWCKDKSNASNIIFPNTPTEGTYWSSSSPPRIDTGDACLVILSSRYSNNGYGCKSRNYNHYVRLVRSSQ